MDTLLPDEWMDHQRVSKIWIENRWVPYPFQNNIQKLSDETLKECLHGLIEVYKHQLFTKPRNFYEWMNQSLGEGIVKHFMFPYNFKVWAYHPEKLNSDWVGERAALADLEKVVFNILEKKDDVSWGPNNIFRFPKKGGTGEIWKRLSEKIGKEKILLEKEAVDINTAEKTITFSSNEKIKYEYLISTIPLDRLVLLSDLSKETKNYSSKLIYSSTHIIGIGMEGRPNEELSKICWMYFPENNCPFYRATLFSKYSPYNVPDSKNNWSLMLEVSESNDKKVNSETIIDEVIQGLINTKLITRNDKIISVWYHREEYGYPTPSVERNEALEAIMPELMKRKVYSRGRFGMWKYEVSNQDHSLMQGVEAVDHIINGTQEITAWFPHIANGPKPY